MIRSCSLVVVCILLSGCSNSSPETAAVTDQVEANKSPVPPVVTPQVDVKQQEIENAKKQFATIARQYEEALNRNIHNKVIEYELQSNPGIVTRQKIASAVRNFDYGVKQGESLKYELEGYITYEHIFASEAVSKLSREVTGAVIPDQRKVDEGNWAKVANRFGYANGQWQEMKIEYSLASLNTYEDAARKVAERTAKQLPGGGTLRNFRYYDLVRE